MITNLHVVLRLVTKNAGVQDTKRQEVGTE